jgi:VanZ family protein
MESAKKILAKKTPALVWTILIFILLALPGSMLPSETHFRISNFDKYVHISLFGVFVVLWSYYFMAKTDRKNKNVFLRFFIIACLYGIGMEYVQKYFIPFRDFDVYDILADIVGAALGYFIARLAFIRRHKAGSTFTGSSDI